MSNKKSKLKMTYLLDTSVLLSALNLDIASLAFLDACKDNISLISPALQELFFLIDKKSDTNSLKSLNKMRNYLMHFSYSGIVDDEKNFLKFFNKLSYKYNVNNYVDMLLLFNSSKYDLTLITLDKQLMKIAEKEHIKVMTPTEALRNEKGLH